ncbi:MAG: pilus assembly protein PilM [Phycisphaeraceae bacterium]
MLAPKKNRPTPASVTAVDFDGHVVRIAQVSYRGRRPKITYLGAVDLPAELDQKDSAACGAWLGEALRGLKVKSKNGVVMGIPRGQVMLKPITLPMPDDPDELAGMVHFQVGKELPFPAEEAVVDFTIHRYHEAKPSSADKEKAEDGEGDAGPTVDVLAAITRRSVVEHYGEMAQAADLKLIGLGLRSYANVRTVEACGVDDNQQAVGLVSLRPDEVIIDILVESRLAFSRVAAANLQGHHDDAEAQGHGDEDEDEKVDLVAEPADGRALIAGVTKEVVRSLHGYRVHPEHKEVGHVIVAGETGRELAVAAALAERLGVPCHPIDPASDLGYKGQGADRASAAVAAIGLAISATDKQGLPFDFLHPTRPTVKKDHRRLKMATAAAAVLLVIVGIGYQRVTQMGQRERTLEGIRSQVEDLRDMRDEFRRIQLHARNVDEWVEGRRSWLNHYLYLSSVLPPSEEVYVSNFATTTSGSIRLNLHARSGKVLIDLDRRLRDAGYIVKPLAVTPGNDPHGYNFRTTVELSIPSPLPFDADTFEDLTVPPRPEDDIYRHQQSAASDQPAVSDGALAQGGEGHE